MTWLARDVWSSTDASDGRPFTWSAANAAVETPVPAGSQAIHRWVG